MISLKRKSLQFEEKGTSREGIFENKRFLEWGFKNSKLSVLDLWFLFSIVEGISFDFCKIGEGF